jgi:hypothetical protein
LKSRRKIIINVSNKRYRRKLKSKKKRLARRFKTHLQWERAKVSLGGDVSYGNLLDKWLPVNASYLLTCKESDFYVEKVIKNVPDNLGVFKMPRTFSLIDNPEPSYEFIKNILGALVLQKYSKMQIDYSECKRVDLGAQVVLDIILKDIFQFYSRCGRFKQTTPRVKEIGGINISDVNVRKLLFSVGSPAILGNKTINYPDIIPYSLCVHDREVDGDPIKIREQKDLDTTKLVDYVLNCLKSLNRTMTDDKREDLSNVIGETLINAEEHATTKFRFSIGYFHKIKQDGKNFGVFRLVILNFGKTIYEKFKDPECPNKVVVEKMKILSESYNTKKYFFSRVFEEETLWTLYALQDGVSSIAPERFKRRGTGSITFIESFFNIKGRMKEFDDVSKMTILSGSTNITFDGSYNITTGMVEDEPFKYMTFNSSGNIEDKPDDKYVKFVSNYFPGTLISAKILFNEDDLIEEIKNET